ncbi:MAG TPA: hypothetical protein PLS28_01715 [Clostridiales bacterium]|nr:hypothetical protein [Clostridiales bacterium]
MTAPIIITVLLLAAIVTLEIFAWKRGDPYFWVLTFLLDIGGNITLLIFAVKNYSMDLQLELGKLNMIDPPPYMTYAVICLFLSFVFFTSTIISIVLCVGKHAIDKREKPHLY